MLANIWTGIVFLNTVWGGGLEATLGIFALIAAVPAVWVYFLPKYTAVCCHDGKKWIDVSGIWSAARGVVGNDLEQFTKQWLGQTLTGKFITTSQARIPVNPVPRRHHISFFGKRRGIFYIVGVKIIDPPLLEKFSGRVNKAPVKFEKEDEYLPL
jgi:hypothetical protein